ncbi:MAG: hypothetical protein ABJE95_27510 [Byssovorax sp.]
MSGTVDPRILLDPRVFERARAIVELAYRDKHIDAYERGVFENNLEISETNEELSCPLARSIVSDLGNLVSAETPLGQRVADFLRTTPPTRGGLFVELDRVRAAEADASPRAAAELVRIAREHVRQAGEQKRISISESAMLLEQLEGDLVAEADVLTVGKQLSARARSARLGARDQRAPKGRGLATLANATGRPGAPK